MLVMYGDSTMESHARPSCRSGLEAAHGRRRRSAAGSTAKFTGRSGRKTAFMAPDATGSQRIALPAAVGAFRRRAADLRTMHWICARVSGNVRLVDGPDEARA